MSKVITFSRVFPSYHPRAGEATGFIYMIWKSIGRPDSNFVWPELKHHWINYESVVNDIHPKHHTIRAGHRFKVGDWFSPRVWSGKPYRSKQIQFAPDIHIRKVWDFEVDAVGVYAIAKSGEQLKYTFQPIDNQTYDMDDRIAQNDGLNPEDFYWWFSRSPEFQKQKGFLGQIICWNESIEY